MNASLSLSGRGLDGKQKYDGTTKKPKQFVIPAKQSAKGLESNRIWAIVSDYLNNLRYLKKINGEGSSMKILTALSASFLFLAAVPVQAQSFTSASCLDQNKRGSASCKAVCPKGQVVLHCGYNLGNYGSGDTCKSISRFQIGATDPTGQPFQQPHDRCSFAVQCSDSSKTLTVQGFATCFQP